MSTFVPILLDGQVNDEEMRKRDMKKAMKISIYTMLSSIMATTVLYLI